MIRLENEADAAVAEVGQFPFGKRGDVLSGKMDFARVRRVQSADQMQQRAFARAGRAAQREEFAARHVEIDAAQDFERAPAHRVGLGQRAGGKQRFGHGRPPHERDETFNAHSI